MKLRYLIKHKKLCNIHINLETHEKNNLKTDMIKFENFFFNCMILYYEN